MAGLWAAVAAMTGAAIFVVLASLARSRPVSSGPSADEAVYRDQIDEIARDRARGLIDDREAEAARAEVARRLLAASDESGSAVPDQGLAVWRRRLAALVALIVVPLVSLGGYAALGRPEMPDWPLAGRRGETAAKQSIADLVSRAEAALAKNPNDGRGWAAVAPIYLRLGRADDAARAYGAAIRLLGSTPEREADYGEALFAAAGGVVTGDARQAFERSVQGDDPSLKGTVYLARAAEQDGDVAGAIARLKPLLAAAADERNADALRGELERLAAVPALPTPKMAAGEDVKTPEQRMAMVRMMVDGLGDRLAAQGGDVGEWLRLVKARSALGEVDKAKAALAEARRTFAGDGKAAARLDALALGLGLEGGGA